MIRPACITQPGAPQEPRIVAAEARGRMIEIELRAGDTLLHALHRGFAAEGFRGGVARLGALALAPFAYVMPALSKTAANAAFYSETFRPLGVARLEQGAITVGERDGAPFFHCHAIWREADGKRSGGHILPEETIVAETARIEALGVDGALFDARQDSETNFKLFAPRAAPANGAIADTRVVALRLKPNQDFLAALEDAAMAAGVRRAKIAGGVGSLIGAAFADGEIVANFATEAFVASGEIAPGPDGRPRATVDAALVDHTGALASGRLVKGANPVLMTFELALHVLD